MKIEDLSRTDLEAVWSAMADAKAMEGMTKGQRARQRVRWMVERGELTPPQLGALCSSDRATCVVHAEDWKP